MKGLFFSISYKAMVSEEGKLLLFDQRTRTTNSSASNDLYQRAEQAASEALKLVDAAFPKADEAERPDDPAVWEEWEAWLHDN